MLEWSSGMTLIIDGLDVYGPEPRITITRTPGTDEFALSVTAGRVGTVTFVDIGESSAVNINTFEGTGTFDEYGLFLVFTGPLNTDTQFLCAVPELVGRNHDSWGVFIPITDIGLEGIFEGFEYSIPGVPIPIGASESDAGANSELPDDFEGDEEIEAAPPATPDECFLTENTSRDIVGVITATSGHVEVQPDLFADFETVTAGSIDAQADPSLVASTFLVRQGDIVRVRDDSLARMTYFEQAIPLARLADSQGTAFSALLEAGSAEIDLLPDTVICLSDNTDETGDTNPIVDIFNGVIHWASDRWIAGTAFTTRPGTTIVGIRGTEFVAGYDAATGTATVLVSDGTVEMIDSGDQLLLDAGSWAMSRDDVGIVTGPTVTEDGGFDTVVSSDRPLSALSDVTDKGGSSPLL
jgi:hypothetical protein